MQETFAGMNDDEIPPDEGPVTDPAELERLIRLGVENPALHGPMFRALLGARVWFLVPPHPELVSHSRDQADSLTWLTFKDDKGRVFAPVFASVEAAERRAERLPDPKPMMMEAPAHVVLAHMNSAKCSVRLIASTGAEILLHPKALESLLQGRLTRMKPPKRCGETMMVRPVKEEDIPRKLLQAIRVFCVQRQGAMAVYAFRSVNKETGELNMGELRLMLRLRDDAGHFYNDFRMMVSRFAPKDCELVTGAVPPDDEAGLAHIATCNPLWPILRG